MSVDSDIIEGVFELIDTTDLLVAYPNVSYDGEKPYIRPFILQVPTVTHGVSVNGFVEHPGIIQIDVVLKEGDGSLKGELIIGEIFSLFPKGLRIYKNNTVIRIDTKGYRSPAISDKSEYFIPLNFNYRVLTNEV